MYPYLAYRNARESMKCIYLFQERLRGLQSNPRNTIIHSSFPLFPLVYIVIRKSFVCRQLFLQIFPPACEICTRTFTELRLFPIAFIPRKVQMHPSFARRHEIHSSLLCFFPFFPCVFPPLCPSIDSFLRLLFRIFVRHFSTLLSTSLEYPWMFTFREFFFFFLFIFITTRNHPNCSQLAGRLLQITSKFRLLDPLLQLESYEAIRELVIEYNF